MSALPAPPPPNQPSASSAPFLVRAAHLRRVFAGRRAPLPARLAGRAAGALAEGDMLAVDDVSLQVRAGEIYGLVGPDGAGKTTTLRLLCGAYRPTPPPGGPLCEIEVAGCSLPDQVDEARLRLGYLPQRFSLYEDLTVLENIRFFAEARGLTADEWLPRCMEILRFVGLDEFINRRAGHLSGGMKQKLGLAAALVHRPSVLLLDEPTTGVDPVTRQDFWQLLIRLVNEGRSPSLGRPSLSKPAAAPAAELVEAPAAVAEPAEAPAAEPAEAPAAEPVEAPAAVAEPAEAEPAEAPVAVAEPAEALDTARAKAEPAEAPAAAELVEAEPAEAPAAELAGGVAVLVSTPYMDEAARCHRVGFMHAGRLRLEGTPAELRRRLEGRVAELAGSPLMALRRAVEKQPGVSGVQMFGDRLHLRFLPGQAEAALPRLQASLAEQGLAVERLRLIPPTLEDVYMDLLESDGEQQP